MSHVNPTLPQPGEEINASDISVPINQIKDVINGGLDDSNFGIINGSKIADNTISTAKLADGSVIPAKLGLTKTTDANGWTTIDLGVFKMYLKNSVWTGNVGITANDTYTAPNENTPVELTTIPSNATVLSASWSNDRSLLATISANQGSNIIQRNVVNGYSSALTLTGAKWYITIIVPAT